MKQILCLLILLMFLTSCENFLEIGPNTNELDAELVFKNDNTASATLNAVYFELQKSGFASGNNSSLTFLGNTLADDAKENNKEEDRYEFFQNKIRSNNDTNYNIWSTAYTQLYKVNILLEGVQDNSFLSEEVKNRIEGEAKFIRAFIYYYLINFYGEVPLILTTDYNDNKSLNNTQVNEIKMQIQEDLLNAKDLLQEDYRFANGQHTIPTKYAAYTLLARLSLLEKDFAAAIDYSSQVINSGNYRLESPQEVFLANSEESIWQLLPVDPIIGTNEGYYYILESNPETLHSRASLRLDHDLLSIWEPGDLRYSHWIDVYTEGENDYYYPFKYKIKNGGDTEEYSMVMRLAEVYLIRAEAYAMSDKPEKAIDDLNTIRNRAGLADWSISDVPDIKEVVLEERRRELFSEWGHRWLDLKRFGKLDEVLGAKKPNWNPHAKLLPIPEQDLLRNPFLTQNPGY